MSSDLEQDIVVTGLGVVTPIGVSVADFWDSCLVGRSGLRAETRMDLGGLPCGWVTGRLTRSDREAVLARTTGPGLAWTDVLMEDAVSQALRDAGAGVGAAAAPVLVWSRVWPGPTGSDPDAYAAHFDALGAGRPTMPAPELADRSDFAARIAGRLGVPVQPLRVEATCAGGLRAIIEAIRLLRLGRADLAVVSAGVSRNTPYVLSQYAQLMAMSRWRGPAEQSCRPFDRKRCGMVINESAGALVLETRKHAAARGVAGEYARLSGWGLELGTGHPTAPGADQVERVMRAAIHGSGLTPDQVDSVNAHGTSTKLNDLVEAQAMHRIFGTRTGEVVVSAVKSLTGHGSAASGVVEVAAAALTVSQGIIPPVVTCTEPDPACDVTTLTQPARRPVNVLVKNSFGFGGQYASLVVKCPVNPRLGVVTERV